MALPGGGIAGVAGQTSGTKVEELNKFWRPGKNDVYWRASLLTKQLFGGGPEEGLDPGGAGERRGSEAVWKKFRLLKKKKKSLTGSSKTCHNRGLR